MVMLQSKLHRKTVVVCLCGLQDAESKMHLFEAIFLSVQLSLYCVAVLHDIVTVKTINQPCAFAVMEMKRERSGNLG